MESFSKVWLHFSKLKQMTSMNRRMTVTTVCLFVLLPMWTLMPSMIKMPINSKIMTKLSDTKSAKDINPLLKEIFIIPISKYQ